MIELTIFFIVATIAVSVLAYFIVRSRSERHSSK